MNNGEVKILINFEKYEKLKNIAKEWEKSKNESLGLIGENPPSIDEKLEENKEHVENIIEKNEESANQIETKKPKNPSTNESPDFVISNYPNILAKIPKNRLNNREEIINGLQSGLFQVDSQDNLVLQNKRVLGEVNIIVPYLFDTKRNKDPKCARFRALFFALFPADHVKLPLYKNDFQKLKRTKQ